MMIRMVTDVGKKKRNVFLDTSDKMIYLNNWQGKIENFEQYINAIDDRLDREDYRAVYSYFKKVL